MNTAYFTKDILCNKCGINGLRTTSPSLLLKIGNSFVDDVPYANYLRIGVASDILSTVRETVDDFLAMMSSDIIVVNTSEERNNQFHFHGFYKQLLDIELVRHDVRSPIIIDPYKEEIFFPGINAKATGVTRRERALYALLLCCGRDGLNFLAPRSAHALAKYNKRMEAIQEAYAAIYEMFGGNPDTAPDLRVADLRTQMFSRLRSSIRKLKGLYNPQDYNLSTLSKATYSVHIEPELVSVTSLHSDSPVPLLKSDLYKLYTQTSPS